MVRTSGVDRLPVPRRVTSDLEVRIPDGAFVGEKKSVVARFCLSSI
jgi:hypothetical protein